MSDEPTTFVVPTELERTDGFFDIAVLAGTLLGVWYGALYGVSLLLMGVLVVPVAIWTLTGEPAADIPYLGAVATGLRSKLGWRRAHEWALVFLHYVRLVHVPIWEARCAAFLNSCRQRIMQWRARLSAWTSLNHSPARSWAFRIRSNWSAKLGK